MAPFWRLAECSGITRPRTNGRPSHFKPPFALLFRHPAGPLREAKGPRSGIHHGHGTAQDRRGAKDTGRVMRYYPRTWPEKAIYGMTQAAVFVVLLAAFLWGCKAIYSMFSE
jgi:hypothetical protein